jgi:hypothetical protein
VNELLSLWRSPIDRVAIVEAHKLAAMQPRCDKTIDQLPNTTNPAGNDLVALYRQQSNITVNVALSVLADFFGSGGGGGGITNTTDLSGLAIYNYGAFQGLPPNTAAQNNAAMVNMLGAMQLNNQGVGGGLGLFQAAGYNIDSTPLAQGGYNVPSQTVLLGAGAVSGSNNSPVKGTFLLSAASTSVPNVFMQLAPGVHSSGGTILKYLGFACTVGANPNTLILSMNGWHPVVEDCTFLRCPQVAQIVGLAGGLFRCTVDYSVTQVQGPNGGSTPATAIVQVMMQEPQTFVDRCEMQQTPISQGGPIGIAAVQPQGGPGARHQTISNNHFVDYSYGVTIAMNSGGTNWHLSILNNEMACFSSALYFGFDSATGGNADCTDVKVIGNTLWQSQNSTDALHDVVFIDPAFVGNSLSLNFASNSIFDGLRDGVRIAGGTVKFNGDVIGGNTNANINITSATEPIVSVAINGVTLAGRFTSSPNNYVSQYGLLVNLTNLGSSSIIEVDHCIFRADLSVAAVHATGVLPAGAVFKITNSAGYNDQKTVVTTNPAAITPGTFQSAIDFGYFGPSLISFSSVAPIEYQVDTLGIVSGPTTWGMAYLPPGVKIQFSPTGPTFISWVGY